ncbi:polyadenylate-binding protein 2-like [Toxorhynchites rutilus septentrionalis]|uniref:polyadenylate-binding protein 2-like n=1 Tax=Toxorhynchites rutilus septentrionalis TaxID=329112 RepID=UPI00247AD1DE|nr:polyadenylate-binding protein 2-like [Toxorhynchites rutilus septentrionalis]
MADKSPQFDSSLGSDVVSPDNLNLLSDDDLLTDSDELADPALKAHVKEMEDEVEKLKQLQSELAVQMSEGDTSNGVPSSDKWVPPILTAEEKAEIDGRSIYVGNVDYGATAEELEKHFTGCGPIYRVNIMCHKVGGQPKGYAYIEFGEKDSVETALAMNDSLFRGRQIKVNAKRTNRPGMSTTNRFPRGSRGRRSFGIARGCSHGGYRGATRRPARGGYRGRATFFAPY